ncbi:Methylated-DNA--protein-cysteine methyltransferase [Dehalobacter sp. DCA]|nr:Methylated-DNA--protein-cysteine methyltransferase [Dehalobacter sp. DCA]
MKGAGTLSTYMKTNMTYTCTVNTPLGKMTAAAVQNELSGLWFIGQKYYPAVTSGWTENSEYPVFETLRRRLDFYFSGQEGQAWEEEQAASTERNAKGIMAGISVPKMDLCLAPVGTDFQKTVWEILLQIPYGKVITYGEIAQRIALVRGLTTMSAQAVGSAVGHNPISILIPCHRVIGGNGKLTGYAGGLDKKKALLRLEGRFLLKNKVLCYNNLSTNK